LNKEIKISKMDEYLTISKQGKYEYKELGSRFIGLTFPVCDKEIIDCILHSNSKQYYDATHHCFAYRLGIDGANFRFNDDGEPNSSAGKPILGAIDSLGVTDVLVIVNRYFGGKKLGVGGLVNAYSISAKESLKISQIISKIIYHKITFSFEHNLINPVMHSIEKYSAKVFSQNYGDNAIFVIDIKPGLIPEFKEFLTAKTNGKVKFE
jgi:uncharacterized YigZ family protein